MKLATPEVVSEAVALKETGPMYHPFEPDVPLSVPLIFGG